MFLDILLYILIYIEDTSNALGDKIQGISKTMIYSVNFLKSNVKIYWYFFFFLKPVIFRTTSVKVTIRCSLVETTLAEGIPVWLANVAFLFLFVTYTKTTI